MDKIFQKMEKQLGMSAINATFSMDANKTNVLTWRLFLASSMKAAIHLGPDFLTNSEIYENTKFEKIWSVFNITRKLVQEHSEEILHVECPEYSSPSWMTSMLANDQAVKWPKAKVCVYTDSVLSVTHTGWEMTSQNLSTGWTSCFLTVCVCALKIRFNTSIVAAVHDWMDTTCRTYKNQRCRFIDVVAELMRVSVVHDGADASRP